MRVSIFAAGAMLAMGAAGAAFAQGDVIAERRAGLRQMGQHMEAIGQTVNARGDQRALTPRIDQMIAFYQSFPPRFPTPSLTPPVAQGTGDGQTRALAVIDTGRADFATKTTAMVTALTALKASAEAGSINADQLRSTGGTCGSCHQTYRAR